MAEDRRAKLGPVLDLTEIVKRGLCPQVPIESMQVPNPARLQRFNEGETVDKPCEICGKMFSPATQRSKYCLFCKSRAQAEAQKRYNDKLRANGLFRAYRKHYNDKAKEIQHEAVEKSKTAPIVRDHAIFVPRLTISNVQELHGDKLVRSVNEILAGRKALASV